MKMLMLPLRLFLAACSHWSLSFPKNWVLKAYIATLILRTS
jgi:hypothetical protein